MHEPAIADAFAPPHFTVLGVSLLHFTLGHEIVLWQRRNPVVAYTRQGFHELPVDEQTRALTQAVEICSRQMPLGARLANRISRYLPRKIAFYASKWLSRGWSKTCVKLDLGDEINKFYDYLAANKLDLPTVRQPRVQGVPFHYFGSPEVARLLNYVTAHHSAMIHTHFEGSPLNFQYGLARILELAQSESEGNIWVQNYHDYEVRQRADAYDKAHPDSELALGEEAVQRQAEKWNAEHPDCPVPLPNQPKHNAGGAK